MTVFENEGRWDASNVWFEAGEIHRYDKKQRTPEMRHIDYGLAFCARKSSRHFLTTSHLIWRIVYSPSRVRETNVRV